MKKLFTVILVFAVVVSMVFAGGNREAGTDGPYKVQFSTENGAEDIESQALYEIRDILNESGLFECEVFI